jgi:hypothetical protein
MYTGMALHAGPPQRGGKETVRDCKKDKQRPYSKEGTGDTAPCTGIHTSKECSDARTVGGAGRGHNPWVQREVF